MRSPRIMLVTDDAFSDETVLRTIDAIAEVSPPGAFAVQLRDKRRTGEERLAWAWRLREWTASRGVSLIVNGDARLARDVEADGAHFGSDAARESIDAAFGLWRSVAAHRDEEVVAARRAGVDAVLVSPIFASPGKGAPRGVEAVSRGVGLAAGEISVIALGGVGAVEARACFAAGAGGVAAIRSLLAASAPASIARLMLAEGE